MGTSRRSAKKSSKKVEKQVVMLCRICKNKFPKDNATALISRKSKANKISLINGSPHKKIESLKTFTNVDSKSVEKKHKKKRQKDENAGLIIPGQISAISQNNYGKTNENKLANAYKDNKLMQLLMKKGQTEQQHC